jgi:protein-disulfide isomerase
LPALQKALAQGEYASKVDDDRALARRAGVQGTPAFFLNGVRVEGAMPLATFTAIVDKELARAKAMEAAGVPRNAIYAKATEERFAENTSKPDEEEEDTKTVFRVPVDGSPARGPADAPVTVVAFSDFQCPYCRMAARTVAALEGKYPGQVRVVFKNEPLPFHKRAEPAAQLALEARAQKGEPAFWAMHDALFAASDLESSTLSRLAEEAGLDVKKALKAVESHAHRERLEKDEDLAEDVAAMGTPHFFINGRRLMGARPLDQFEAIVREELEHAQRLAKQGVAPGKLYEAMVDQGAHAPEPEKVAMPFPPTAPTRGAAKGVVVIQQFSDFECPYCARAEETLKAVMDRYPKTVRIVWRDMPLPMHKHAELAAEAARAAKAQKGDAGFWAMHQQIYGALGKDGGLSRQSLEEMARAISLDVGKFKASLDSHGTLASIQQDKAAAEAAGISGTPVFVVGEYRLEGARSFAAFRRLVERVLREQGEASRGKR